MPDLPVASIQGLMDKESLAGLRAELAALEEEEARVSAERRHQHRQIDFGYSSENTQAREREVSDHRRELHARIDAIRERLGLGAGPQRASVATGLDQVPHGIGELERIVDPDQRIDAPSEESPLL